MKIQKFIRGRYNPRLDRPLTQEEAKKLKPGDQVRYQAGADGSSCEAYAEVILAGSMTSLIKITQMIDQGEWSRRHVGEAIFAAHFELRRM